MGIFSFSYLFMACLTVYLMVLGYLFFFQRAIIYVPEKGQISLKGTGLQGFKAFKLATSDGEEIDVWQHNGQGTGPLIVYFHGNAGNLADRVEKFRAFTEQGFRLFAIGYRGYGSSTGTPSEQGLYNDARSALAYLYSKGEKDSDIVLFGESLGSGVAIQMAVEHKVKAVVLEAPYTSVANRGAELYPYIPVRWLIKDQFDSESKVGSVISPVLVFHGEKDDVMPVHHGKRLFELANEPKEAHFFDDVGHTDFDETILAKYTEAFLQQYAK